MDSFFSENEWSMNFLRTVFHGLCARIARHVATQLTISRLTIPRLTISRRLREEITTG
jgi:hypothetical protein